MFRGSLETGEGTYSADVIVTSGGGTDISVTERFTFDYFNGSSVEGEAEVANATQSTPTCDGGYFNGFSDEFARPLPYTALITTTDGSTYSAVGERGYRAFGDRAGAEVEHFSRFHGAAGVPVFVSGPTAPTLPTSKDQCKNGGWFVYNTFKNQGECVSYVASGGLKTPAAP